MLLPKISPSARGLNDGSTAMPGAQVARPAAGSSPLAKTIGKTASPAASAITVSMIATVRAARSSASCWPRQEPQAIMMPMPGDRVKKASPSAAERPCR